MQPQSQYYNLSQSHQFKESTKPKQEENLATHRT
ncbi:hypothetical protein LINGRAHAP2_LOCUS608 [Linum grandiflorum]